MKDISASSKSGVSDVKVDTQKSVEVETEGIDKPRPSWRQSEIDVEKKFPEYNAQKSFKMVKKYLTKKKVVLDQICIRLVIVLR